jgi:glycosyltransferase involved in cell wall biosynthesis
MDLLNVGVGRKSQYISIASEGATLTFLSKEEARRLLKIVEGVPVVLWMARMAPVKNPGLALEVARLLPEVNFLLAGGGDLFEQTKANAPKNVLMLGWVDAAVVIPAADVFLSTSLNEGVPYSLIEVQSCGIPIVAVDSGAINELITDGVSGVLSKPESSELALKLKSLLNDNPRMESMGLAARAQREVISGKPLMVDAHKTLYEKILR